MTDQMKKINPNFWVVTLMVFAAAFVRLLPHPPNFAPIAAMALFGGAYFNKKSFAFVIPLVAMFLTDAIIGFYSYAWMVYISFALIVLVGIVMLKKVNVKNLEKYVLEKFETIKSIRIDKVTMSDLGVCNELRGF